MLVVALAALLLVTGAWTASRMPVDVFPDLTAPTVTVLTEAHGMAPEEVEALVTFPIETAVNGATGVRRVRSSTAQGISVVWVEFEWGTDIFRARQIVTEKLQRSPAQLPGGVSPPALAPVSSVMGEIMMIGLTGTQSPQELRTTADWTLRRRLLAVPGVSQVMPIGGEVKQYQVLADPARMLATGVTLVGDRERRGASPTRTRPAACTWTRARSTWSAASGGSRRVDDIALTVVKVRNGVPILLGQVADVVIGAAPKFGEGSINAKPGVVLAVQKQPDANTLELTRRIEAELADIQRTLPPGMRDPPELFRQADFIQVAIDNVVAALRDGAILVVVILFLFLWNVRTTAISLLAIPLSLVVAIFAMKLLGITINTMTLGGMAIAIGALVDDAIIDVENVFRRLKENHHRPPERAPPAFDVVFEATREIRASIVIATLIIVVVFLPLFFLPGVEGRLLRPARLRLHRVDPRLAGRRGDRDAGALPPTCSRDSKSVQRGAREPAGRLAQARATPARWTRAGAPEAGPGRRPRRAAGHARVAARFLGRSFLPEFNEGALTVSVVTVPGTSLDESDAIGRRVEEILLANPAVREHRPPPGPRRAGRARPGRQRRRDRCDARARRRQGAAARRPAARVRGNPRHQRHHRPADRPPHRSHALGHAGQHRRQDLRSRPLPAAAARHAGARRDRRRRRGSRISSSSSRSTCRSSGFAATGSRSRVTA